MRGLLFGMALLVAPGMAVAQSASSTDFSPAGAEAFVSQIFSAWSGPDASTLNGLYTDEVNFYGSIIPAEKVRDANNRFAARWQTRLYTVSSFDLDQCAPATSACTVSGVVHWDDHAPGPKLHSVGDASFSYTLKYDNGAFLISGENGKVMDRAITADDQPPPTPAVTAQAPQTETQPPSWAPPSVANDTSNSDDSQSQVPASQDSAPADNAPAPASDDRGAGLFGIGVGLVIFLGILGLCFYFLPCIVSSSRKATNGGVTFIINLLLGWTLIGWIAALLIACFSQTQTGREIERETLRRLKG